MIFQSQGLCSQCTPAISVVLFFSQHRVDRRDVSYLVFEYA